MNPALVVAVLLIALGAGALACEGITRTSMSRGVNVGPMQMAAGRTHDMPLPQALGVFAPAGGIVLLVAVRKGPGHAAARSMPIEVASKCSW
jgi:hypothetical protein